VLEPERLTITLPSFLRFVSHDPPIPLRLHPKFTSLSEFGFPVGGTESNRHLRSAFARLRSRYSNGRSHRLQNGCNSPGGAGCVDKRRPSHTDKQPLLSSARAAGFLARHSAGPPATLWATAKRSSIEERARTRCWRLGPSGPRFFPCSSSPASRAAHRAKCVERVSTDLVLRDALSGRDPGGPRWT